MCVCLQYLWMGLCRGRTIPHGFPFHGLRYSQTVRYCAVFGMATRALCTCSTYPPPQHTHTHTHTQHSLSSVAGHTPLMRMCRLSGKVLVNCFKVLLLEVFSVGVFGTNCRHTCILLLLSSAPFHGEARDDQSAFQPNS